MYIKFILVIASS